MPIPTRCSFIPASFIMKPSCDGTFASLASTVRSLLNASLDYSVAFATGLRQYHNRLRNPLVCCAPGLRFAQSALRSLLRSTTSVSFTNQLPNKCSFRRILHGSAYFVSELVRHKLCTSEFARDSLTRSQNNTDILLRPLFV